LAGLARKYTLKIVAEAIGFCDGTVPPDPIIAARRILDTDPSAFEQYMPQLTAQVGAVLEMENEGQGFYDKTFSAVSSLLYTLWRLQGEDFDAAYLEPMFRGLPPRCDAMNVFSVLTYLFGQNAAFFVPFAGPLIRGLGETLALKKKEFDELQLTPQVFQAMVAMFLQIVRSVPDGMEIVRSTVSDEFALVRLGSRVPF
jgi:hypothetical protein